MRAYPVVKQEPHHTRVAVPNRYSKWVCPPIVPDKGLELSELKHSLKNTGVPSISGVVKEWQPAVVYASTCVDSAPESCLGVVSRSPG